MIAALCLLGAMVYVGCTALDSAFDVRGFRWIDQDGRRAWLGILCGISGLFYLLAAALAVALAKSLMEGRGP